MNYLAIDVGGTFIKYAVITDQCSISVKDKTPTRQDSMEIFIDSLVEIYEKVSSSYELDGVA